MIGGGRRMGGRVLEGRVRHNLLEEVVCQLPANWQALYVNTHTPALALAR